MLDKIGTTNIHSAYRGTQRRRGEIIPPKAASDNGNGREKRDMRTLVAVQRAKRCGINKLARPGMNASLIAQLIAHRLDMLQTRFKRRATIERTEQAYEAAQALKKQYQGIRLDAAS